MSGFRASVKKRKEGRRDFDSDLVIVARPLMLLLTMAVVMMSALGSPLVSLLALVCGVTVATVGVKPGLESAWWPTGVFHLAAMLAAVAMDVLPTTPSSGPPPPSDMFAGLGCGCTREEGHAHRSRLISG